MESKKNFTITIPCWNNTDITGQSILHIISHFGNTADFILIENFSPHKDTPLFLKKAADKYPNVKAVRPHRRATISECLNYGISQAKTPYFIALDDDVKALEVVPERIAELIDSCPEIGILSPWFSDDSDTWTKTEPEYKSLATPIKLGNKYNLLEIPTYMFGAFMVMRIEDLLALKKNNGQAFREPGAYGSHDRWISESFHELGKKLIYDPEQLAYHKAIPITDPNLLLWKKFSQACWTRLPFAQWKHLYIDNQGKWWKAPMIRLDEIMGTKIFGEKWAGIKGKFRRPIEFKPL